MMLTGLLLPVTVKWQTDVGPVEQMQAAALLMVSTKVWKPDLERSYLNQFSF